jgi:hypothetical protein
VHQAGGVSLGNVEVLWNKISLIKKSVDDRGPEIATANDGNSNIFPMHGEKGFNGLELKVRKEWALYLEKAQRIPCQVFQKIFFIKNT